MLSNTRQVTNRRFAILVQQSHKINPQSKDPTKNVSHYSNKTLKLLQQAAWESPTNRVFNKLYNNNKLRKGGGKKTNKETE